MAMYSRAIMCKISSQHIKLINDFFSLFAAEKWSWNDP